MTRLKTSASEQMSGNSKELSYRPVKQPFMAVHDHLWLYWNILYVSIGMGCIYNNLPKKRQIVVNHLVLAMTLWILKS